MMAIQPQYWVEGLSLFTNREEKSSIHKKTSEFHEKSEAYFCKSKNRFACSPETGFWPMLWQSGCRRAGTGQREESFGGDGEGVRVQYAGDVQFALKGGVIYGDGGGEFLGMGVVSHRYRRGAICVS